MPILRREDDTFPHDLWNVIADQPATDRRWWCLYTMARREKELMRRLVERRIPFYGPLIPKRTRSPSGRIRTSYLPLFPNYVFLWGRDDQRVEALKSNCVSRWMEVADQEALTTDLRQLAQVIAAGIPVTAEARLEAGQPVRVRSGPFAGYEGVVIRREGRTRLLLAVRFLERGVSMEADEGVLEPL
jgi:transcription antitermination factor NusG